MARTSDALSLLLRQQRPNWSLDQPFYLDEDIYAFERRSWLPRQWLLMAHFSEMPKSGSHLVRDLFGESIIIVRSGDEVRAFFNVCTHRGSRICKADGQSPLLVCPYHAWSFKLTGELQSRRDVPVGVDPDTLGLHPVRVEMREGLIFCALPSEDLPDLTPALDALTPAMQRHGFRHARIIARQSYPTNANWKLVVENAFECYHCRNAHPEYTRVNGHVQVTGMHDAAKAAVWDGELGRWGGAIDPNEPHNVAVHEPGSLKRVPFRVARQPIGGGRLTLSQDGKPVSKLMGGFDGYDGGETQFRFGRLSFASATNDYVTLIQIVPRGPQQTDMIFTWLVDADADTTVDAGAVQWMWDVTTRQDKMIVEENAIGVRSQAYRPGPYTALEGSTAAFIAGYLDEMCDLVERSAEATA